MSPSTTLSSSVFLSNPSLSRPSLSLSCFAFHYNPFFILYPDPPSTPFTPVISSPSSPSRILRVISLRGLLLLYPRLEISFPSTRPFPFVPLILVRCPLLMLSQPICHQTADHARSKSPFSFVIQPLGGVHLPLILDFIAFCVQHFDSLSSSHNCSKCVKLYLFKLY